MTSIVEFDQATAESLKATLGREATVLKDLGTLRKHLQENPQEAAVVLGPTVDQATALELASELRVASPSTGVILVRRRVDSMVLTDALRSGVRDVVSEGDLAALADAVGQATVLAAALRQQNPGDQIPGTFRGRVLTVFSPKGGAGKTTFATNMAAVLAEGGRHRVALVDLDLTFGDVAIALQLTPKRTIGDAVRMEETLDLTALRSLMTKHSSGVGVLAGPLNPHEAERISSNLVSKIITLLSTEFDYVVVDCPPSLDDRVLAAFDLSNLVTVISTLDVPALKNTKLTLETFTMLEFPMERVRVVLNRADAKVGLAIADVEKTLGVPMAAHLPSSVDVPSATNRGVVLVTEQPNHPVSQAVRYFVSTSVLGDVGNGIAESAGVASPEPVRKSRFRRRAA